MEAEEKLKLDCEQTTKYFHSLAEVRFKLLGLLPVVTGTAIGLLQSQKPELVVPLSIFGIVVTFGVLCYDQRNSQIDNAMQLRAKSLEARFELESMTGRFRYGGPFLDRPKRELRSLGILMWHDRGLAIVYAAAFAAWSYLLVGSLLQMGQVLTVKIAVPLVVFIVVVLQLYVVDRATDTLGALPEKIRQKLDSNSPDGEQRQ
jgi:hypothetical protein